MLVILMVLPLFAIALNLTESKSSTVHFVQNISDINSMLEALPKECWKSGKTYKEGEEFQIGALRYKCQKYGVYTIEGCVTGKMKNLKIGEVVVVDNVKSQCMAKGDSVFFKETVCGILGQPECDKIPLPTGFQEATKIEDTKPKGKETNVPGLPPGWTMVDESHQEIPGTSARHIISRTLVFHPVIQHARTHRQNVRGVGSVLSTEEAGTDRAVLGEKGSSAENNRFVHSVSQRLNMLNKSGGRIVGHGTRSRDLYHRTSTVSNTKSFKPETMSGSRSDVIWDGKTISVNGRTIAAGPGTFTFGTSPTGVFLRKEH